MAPDPNERANLNQALFAYFGASPLGWISGRERLVASFGEEEGERLLGEVYQFMEETTRLRGRLERGTGAPEDADILVNAIRRHYPQLTEDTLSVLRNAFAYSLSR